MIARTMKGHEAVTVPRAGWAGAKNGELLSLAEGRFNVFVTADKRIKYQQNLRRRRLAVILLPSNQLPVIERILPFLLEALASLQPGLIGQYIEIREP